MIRRQKLNVKKEDKRIRKEERKEVSARVTGEIVLLYEDLV